MVKDGLDGGIGSLINGPSREDGRWQKRMVYLYINLSIAGEGGLLGGFPPYKKIGLTGPVSIYKLLPEVFISSSFVARGTVSGMSFVRAANLVTFVKNLCRQLVAPCQRIIRLAFTVQEVKVF